MGIERPGYYPAVDGKFKFGVDWYNSVGNLCMLNQAAAALGTESVRKASLDAARAKYRQLVILSDDAVRIHSRLGVTVVDLTLPTWRCMCFTPET